ncbi:MAG: SusD/RagB family nutrient-binding outer rane lipoprotein [Ferruginibacter sp.]|uniref:SusD/RagB family nutrient-binding outer membrane lipoprotein n=1 Tax=Ferruginibacter sp. TaxID=1940288 RepID=UPI00265B4CF7|nr:SusD/RagB family nutrient-binding outer membrane lipoprotein [Ferruginibacter sp.]MDB5279416.1 SusD/RagB family nutrient-binding outer rane lipoprotein [Ferruginibacter sp.]
MKRSFIILILSTALLGGCKKYLDVNKDPNNPVDVQEALILAPVEANISDNIFAGNAAINIQYFVQTIAPNQENPGNWSYQLFNNYFDGDWTAFYVAGLNNLRILNDKAEASGKSNYAAIAKILSAYVLGTATDLWGDIPYSQAFQGNKNFTPVYDKQETIYTAVQDLLAKGISDIEKGSAIVPGGDDYFYAGDMDKWKKLAYTLQARYYMHLTNAPGNTAAAQADKALQALNNAMQSNDDDLKFQYEGINTWGQSFDPISTAVLSSTFVNKLVATNDPRLPKLVKKADGTGLYNGRTVGDPVGSLDDYSYPTAWVAGTGAANYIVTYSEALFLKAEATFIKSGAAAAAPIYIQGIQSHFLKLGFDVTAAEVTNYINSRSLTTDNAIQRIMEEKSIANFLNIENFTDWRRTGYPAITKVNGALSDIPRRLLYPESERLSNSQPQQAAKVTDRLWWNP